MKKLFYFLFGIVLIASCEKDLPENKTSSQANLENRSGKVTICHKLGNGNFISISVNQNAVQAHLDHGDYLADADGDGFTAIGACTGTANDCDDTNPNIHPDLDEVCDDGIDNNCNGQVDEDCCPCDNNAILWQKTIGGNDQDFLSIVIKTPDAGYFLAGYSKSSISGDKNENTEGHDDYWVVKLDDSRNIQWQKNLGGLGTDELRYAIQTSDGGYLLGGWSDSNSSGDKSENTKGPYGKGDYWIIKLDGNGNTLWEKTIGGEGSEFCTQVIESNEGGYLIAGNSTSNIYGDKTTTAMGSFDYWILKLDIAGNIQWQNSYGGDGFDFLNSAIQTPDGGYLLGGHTTSGISGNKTTSSNGDADYWIVKINASGSIQWQKSYGGNNSDYLRTVLNTNDGGFFISGHSNSSSSGNKSESSKGGFDYWVVKLNSAGNIVWDKTLGGSVEEDLFRSIHTSDNGFLLGGHSYSGISGDKSETSRGKNDIWIVKLTDNGDVCWQKTIGGNLGDGNITSFTFPFGLMEDSDNNYIIGGSSESGISGDKTEASRGLWDYWIFKITDCN